VDWSLFGRPPPRTAEDWETEFEKYKQSPEFKFKNSEITVEEFKFIWLECLASFWKNLYT
jgi:cytochrome c oxidase assembly protein subunit 15